MRVTQQITFEAKDDAESIRIASERLGRDAVILSSRPVQKGGFLGLFSKTVLVVTAGILEEDVPDQKQQNDSRDRMMAFKNLLEEKKKERTIGPSLDEDFLDISSSSTSVLQSGMAIQNAVKSYEAQKTTELKKDSSRDLTQDVEKIQKTLSFVLERLDAGVIETKEPKPLEVEDVHLNSEGILDQVRSRMIKSEMTATYVDELIDKYDGPEDLESFANWLVDLVKTPYKDNREALGGQRVMFIGPTGVGKTTTIAKLSAVTSLWEDRKVVMATADTYRIAAVEQLRTYAKILGVPIEVIFDVEDLKRVKERYESDLILLDTAGRNQRDSRRLEEIKELYDVFRPDCVHLVISASSKYGDMLDVIDRMGVVPITNILFTKVDETITLGPVLEIALNFDIPISFFTTGQNVPNDIDIASARYLVDLVLGFNENV